MVCEVSEAISAVDNLADLSDNLHAALCRHIPCDWLALYDIHRHDTRINVTTNRGLDFDWDDCYSNIAAIDPANRRALASQPGTCLPFPSIYDPDDERDSYLLEYIRRASDTGMGLVISLANRASDHRLALCLNRQSAAEEFTKPDAALLANIQPLVTACCLNLLERAASAQRSELSSQELLTPYVLFDERWAIVDFPSRSLNLLRSLYQDENLNTLPAEISDWLKLLAMLKSAPGHTGSYVKTLTKRRLELRFKNLRLPDGSSRGLLQLIDKRTVDDFTPLTACGLSQREIALLNYLPTGHTNAQIAAALGIREITVKKHLKSIGDKLGAAGKTEILYAAMDRLLELLRQPRPNLIIRTEAGPNGHD
ncbi:MAG: Bacterial regulatory protein, luxR family [Deltaproteobacteria bacterium ADurb.Bin510]|nr:MAG: Bacterial regulatory protein, luxR family [Deltaproteobacteria bacterium ADurb.Bin510]